MRVVEKYLFTEILRKIIFVTLSLLTIFFIFRIIDESSQTPDVNYTFGSAVVYTLFNVPHLLSQIIVLSCFIGTMFGVITMNENRELIILQTSGYKKSTLSKIFIRYGFVISLIFLFITEITAYSLLNYSEEYKSALKGENSSINREKNITLKFEDNYLLINKNLDGKNLEGIYLLQFNSSNQKVIIESQKGEVEGKKMTLIAPSITTISNSGGFRKIEKRHENSFLLELPFEYASGSFNVKPSTSEILFLIKKIFVLRSNNLNTNVLESELYTRLANPLYVLALLFISVPFSLKFSRSKSLQKRLSITVLVSIIFLFLFKAISVISYRDLFNPFMIIFGLPLLAILVGYKITNKITYD